MSKSCNVNQSFDSFFGAFQVFFSNGFIVHSTIKQSRQITCTVNKEFSAHGKRCQEILFDIPHGLLTFLFLVLSVANFFTSRVSVAISVVIGWFLKVLDSSKETHRKFSLLFINKTLTDIE
jgi:hypothetical protein